MTNNSPVIIIDDDVDDHDFVRDVWTELGFRNKLIFFTTADELLSYLEADSPTPFLVLCDVNLPSMNGFELRKKLLENPNPKGRSVPFIFWSNAASEEQVRKAYDLSVHGFFIKQSSYEKLKDAFNKIMQYWFLNQQPENIK